MSLLARSVRRACVGVAARSAAASASVVPRAVRSFTSSRPVAASNEPPRIWRVDDPYTGEIVTEFTSLSDAGAASLIESSSRAFGAWRRVPLAQRVALLEQWLLAFAAEKESIALDITRQMGKPLAQARGEVDTALKRAQALIAMSGPALAEEVITADPNPSLLRKITKEPIGVVLALVPWNYPLLCAVNSVVTATLAGNSVLLKHSDRTPLCADLFERTFAAAGAPAGLVSAFHADNALVARTIQHPAIAYVQFTGSVGGGRAVYSATAASRFIDVGLELGGKDPAYVADDADLSYAIANVVDGGMYNAGQSCCAVERVYVHEKQYDAFVDGATKAINEYVLGNPRLATTTMGPIAQPHHVAFLEGQIEDARRLGAKVVTGGSAVRDAAGLGRFFAPTLVVDATQQMRVVSEESFGPVLAVTRVASDAEAIRLMNDSSFGLTASIWSRDLERASNIASELETGTVFMNRCDFLDPYLAWSGRKDSGKGIGLSSHGFAPFVRTKSYNFRPNTQ